MALFTTHPYRQILSEDKILSSWSLLIPHGGGRGEKFLDEVERELAKFELSHTTIKRQELNTIKPDGNKGAVVPVCLYIENGVSKTYFAAFDYGKHLILSQINAGEISKTFGVFSLKAIQAGFTVLNIAREAAVEKFAKELNLDLSKLHAPTKGIIDITNSPWASMNG